MNQYFHSISTAPKETISQSCQRQELLLQGRLDNLHEMKVNSTQYED